jgi:hypothetical protein
MLTGIKSGQWGVPPVTKKRYSGSEFFARPGKPEPDLRPDSSAVLPEPGFANYRFIFNSEPSRTVPLKLRERQTTRFLLNHSHP